MLSSLTLVCGCATLFGKKDDVLTIHSKYDNAHFLVDGNEIGMGHATYKLERGKTVIITAHKKGCNDVSMPTSEKLNDTTFVNLLFWPGYLVDAASGSIHQASTTDYIVNPLCRDKDDD